MKPFSNSDYAKLSWVSITLMVAMTAVHHVYRLGLSALTPFLIAAILPSLFWLGYQHQKHKWLLGLYGAFNILLFLAFGLFDGFLDHVLKALGVSNVTFLPGSEAAVVETVYSLWSPQAGHVFYEGTGILTFIIGVVTMYYTHKLLQEQNLWKREKHPQLAKPTA